MNPLRVLSLVVAALALVGVPGCQKGSDKVKVAFVSNNADPFWSIAEAGTQKAAAEHNVEVLFRKPHQGDAAVQKEIIDNLVNQDIKAIAISVIDPKNQGDYLDRIAAKVPLLTQDNDAPNTKRLCYIGTDNYVAGQAVGELVKEVLPDGGIVAIFVGQIEPLNARERRQGVLDALAGAKGAPVDDGAKVGKYTLHKTYLDQPEGQARCKEHAVNAITDLQNEKNVCFVGLWAYNPPAILSAVKDKEKLGAIKIVAFDENPSTLDGIRDGHIHGTVVQNPFKFGEESVRVMAALAKGDRSVLPPDGILYVPHRVITREGGEDRIPVAAFRAELERLLGK